MNDFEPFSLGDGFREAVNFLLNVYGGDSNYIGYTVTNDMPFMPDRTAILEFRQYQSGKYTCWLSFCECQ